MWLATAIVVTFTSLRLPPTITIRSPEGRDSRIRY